jgi:isoleucyl-tRNA synthetase
MLAPILVFTADEIWENLPKGSEATPVSVHLADLPTESGNSNFELLAEWEALFKVRDQVLRSLEDARTAKTIGSSLEARVKLTAGGKTLELLERHRDDLRYIFIVSEVGLVNKADATDDGRVGIAVTLAEGSKCERCWNYSKHVGESERYPTACERCVAALSEIESL